MSQEQTIKKYISALFKRLRLPRKLKKRICEELESEIYSRLEEGEDLQDILSSIGSPEEVQREVEAGYETEFIHFKKSRILLLVVLSVFSVCMALLTVYSLITVLYPQFALPVVIGGSDGNSSFFLAYKFAREEMIAGLIIKTALLILSLAGLFKVFHSIKNKSK